MPTQKKYKYTITEVAKAFGVSPQTVRNWEKQGLLKAQRTQGGTRRYSFSEVKKLSSAVQPRIPTQRSYSRAQTHPYNPPSTTQEAVTPDYIEQSVSNSIPPVPSPAQPFNLMRSAFLTGFLITTVIGGIFAFKPVLTNIPYSTFNIQHSQVLGVRTSAVSLWDNTVSWFKSLFAHTHLAEIDLDVFRSGIISETKSLISSSLEGVERAGITTQYLSGSIAKLPNLTSTYISDLNGSQITNVDAHHLGGVAASGFLRSNEPDTAEAVITFTASPGSMDVNGGSVYINPSGTSFNYTLFGIAVNGNQKFKVDSEGDTTVNGTLSVEGAATLSSSLSVAGASTLTGNTQVGGTLDVTGISTLVGNLNANGGLDIDDAFSVADGGALTTSQTATFNGALVANSSLTVNGQGVFTRVPSTAHTGTWAIDSGNWGVSDSTVYINPASATLDSNLLGLAVAGGVKFAVDAEGDVYAKNIILTGSVSSGSSTVAGDLTVEGNTQLGDAGSDTFTVYPNTITLANTTATKTISAAGTQRLDLTANSATLSIGGTSGNIGIGTTSPATKFQVIGGHIAIDNTYFLEGKNASGTLYNILGTGTDNYTKIGSLGNGLHFINGAQSAVLATIMDGGNVGIGTTSPATRVDIQGPSNANLGMLRIRATDNDFSGLSLWARDSGAGAARNWQISSNYNANGNLDILRSTSNSGNPTTPVASFDSSGNMGIGTTSPTTLLHVGTGGTPTSASTGDGYFLNDLEVDGRIYAVVLDASSGTLNVQNSIIDLSSASRLVISNTLGSTTAFDTTATLTGPSYSIRNRPTFQSTGAGQTSYTTASIPTISASSTNALTYYSGYFTITDANSLANTGYGLYVDGTTANASDTTYALYSNSGTNYFGGTVGIGTTSPSTTLHVVGTGQFTSTLTANTFASSGATLTGGTINNMVIGGSTPAAGTFTTITGTTGSYTGNITITKQDPTVIYNAGNTSDTKFWTGVTDDNGNDDDDLFQIGDGTTPGTNPFLTIDTSGNIGIGTTSPGTAKVAILHNSSSSGWMSLTNNTDGTGAQASFNVFASGGGEAILRAFASSFTSSGPRQATGVQIGGGAYSAGGVGITSAGNFRFHHETFSGGNGELMRIEAAGNVGIGTTTPSQKLHVQGHQYISGNLGIGTTGPTNKLHVYKGSSGVTANSDAGLVVENSTHNYFNMIAPVDTQSGLLFGGAVNNDAGVFWEDGSRGNYLGLSANAASTSGQLVIENGGDVGIGTTNPNVKLDVIGSQFVSGDLVVGTGTYTGTPFGESPYIFAYKNDVSGVIQSSTMIGMEANNQDTWLSFLTQSTFDAGIVFGDEGNAAIGKIAYDHTTDSLSFTTAGTSRLAINGTGNIATNGTAANTAVALYVSQGQTTTSGTQQYGVNSQAVFSSGATSSGTAGYFGVHTAAASYTMGTAYGIYVNTPTKGSGSSITSVRGIQIAAQTGASFANYGMLIDAPSGAGDQNVSLYLSGTPSGANPFYIYSTVDAKLTAAGVWTNAPSWQHLKSDIEYLEPEYRSNLFDHFVDSYKPATFRVNNETDPNTHRGFHFILDDLSPELFDIVTNDGNQAAKTGGAISTKNSEGLLFALTQEAGLRIAKLEDKTKASEEITLDEQGNVVIPKLASEHITITNNQETNNLTINLESKLAELTEKLGLLEEQVNHLTMQPYDHESSSSAVLGESTESASLADINSINLSITNDVNIGNNLSVLGATSLYNTNITGTLNVGLLSISSTTCSTCTTFTTSASLNVLGTLSLQNQFEGGIEIDQKGNLHIVSGTISGNSQIRGSVLIPRGQTVIQVDQAWDTIPTSITATPDYDSNVWITNKSEAGFTINLSRTPTVDRKVDWFAIW